VIIEGLLFLSDPLVPAYMINVTPLKPKGVLFYPMMEITICGRGGQRGVTLARIIASAYFLKGKYVQANSMKHR
jgi:hypothetical protein